MCWQLYQAWRSILSLSIKVEVSVLSLDFFLSPLQIYGLTFFSRRPKKERREKPRKISGFGKNRNLAVRMLPVLVRRYSIPKRRQLVRHLILQEQGFLPIVNQLSYLLVVIFAFQDTTLILSSQQFLSHHLRTLIVQDRSQNTEIF